LDDAVGAIQFAMATESLSGPVNVVSPNPVTNREFANTLGRVLRRPVLLPLPAPVVWVVMGEMGRELLLGSARVQPIRLEAEGYRFRYRQLEPALRALLGR
jgi:NAD dependent epimerase/dehydratase family enzyme